MNILKTIVLTSCLAAVLPLSSSAAFKSVPIEPGFLEGARVGVSGFAVKPTGEFNKEPEFEGKKYYGSLYMQRKALNLVAYAGKASGDIDTVLIDFDDDKDITDETPITSRGSTVNINGKPTKVRLALKSQETAPGHLLYTVIIQPAEWFQGRLKVGTSEYDSVLIDAGFDGLDDKGGDYLILDQDKDGKLDRSESSIPISPMFQITPNMLLDGKVWNCAIDSEKPDLTLTPYKGATGTLEIKTKLSSLKGKVTFGCQIKASGNGMAAVPYSEGTVTTLVPAGPYDYAYIFAAIEKDPMNSVLLQYAPKEQLIVKKDSKVNMVLGIPTDILVKATQKGNKLVVEKSLETPEGLLLGAIYYSDPKEEFKNPPAPRVDVFTADGKDTFISSGSMEYG